MGKIRRISKGRSGPPGPTPQWASRGSKFKLREDDQWLHSYETDLSVPENESREWRVAYVTVTCEGLSRVLTSAILTNPPPPAEPKIEVYPTVSLAGQLTLNWTNSGTIGPRDYVALFRGQEAPTNTNGYLRGLWQWASRGRTVRLQDGSVLHSYKTWEKLEESQSGTFVTFGCGEVPRYHVAYIVEDTTGSRTIAASSLTPEPVECNAGPDVQAQAFVIDTSPPVFRRGDANGDGAVDTSDAIANLRHQFLGKPEFLECEKAADTDDSGVIDLSDAISVLTFLFLGDAPPTAPYPNCGLEDTPDDLECKS